MKPNDYFSSNNNDKGLNSFYDIFGKSEDEDEFEGFTSDDYRQRYSSKAQNIFTNLLPSTSSQNLKPPSNPNNLTHFNQKVENFKKKFPRVLSSNNAQELSVKRIKLEIPDEDAPISPSLSTLHSTPRAKDVESSSSAQSIMPSTKTRHRKRFTLPPVSRISRRKITPSKQYVDYFSPLNSQLKSKQVPSSSNCNEPVGISMPSSQQAIQDRSRPKSSIRNNNMKGNILTKSRFPIETDDDSLLEIFKLRSKPIKLEEAFASSESESDVVDSVINSGYESSDSADSFILAVNNYLKKNPCPKPSNNVGPSFPASSLGTSSTFSPFESADQNSPHHTTDCDAQETSALSNLPHHSKVNKDFPLNSTIGQVYMPPKEHASIPEARASPPAEKKSCTVDLVEEEGSQSYQKSTPLQLPQNKHITNSQRNKKLPEVKSLQTVINSSSYASRTSRQSKVNYKATKNILKRAKMKLFKNGNFSKAPETEHLDDKTLQDEVIDEISDAIHPATFVCMICGQVKYSSIVHKNYGQESCDRCFIFFSKFLEHPKQYYCSNNGACSLKGPLYSRETCSACLLKVCLLKFFIPPDKHSQVQRFLPRLADSTRRPLINELPHLGTKINEMKNKLEQLHSHSKQEPSPSPGRTLMALKTPPQDSSLLRRSTTKESPFQSPGRKPLSFSRSLRPRKSSNSFARPDIDSKKKNSDVELPPPLESSQAQGDTKEILQVAGQDLALLMKQPKVALVRCDVQVALDQPKESRHEEVAEVESSTESPSITGKKEEKEEEEENTEVDNDSDLSDEYPSKKSLIEKVLATFRPTEEDAVTDLNPEPPPMELPKKFEGPRIKHVCRRADLVVGGPVRATFSEVTDNSTLNLSALPPAEKNKIVEKVTEEDESDSENIPQNANRLTSLITGKRSRHNSDSSSEKKLPLHEEAGQKERKRGRVSEDEDSDFKVSKIPKRPRFKKVRCKKCEGCLAEDCGKCINCLDKKKFGGPNIIRRACIHRRCLYPILPLSQELSLSRRPPPDKDDEESSSSRPPLCLRSTLAASYRSHPSNSSSSAPASNSSIQHTTKASTTFSLARVTRPTRVRSTDESTQTDSFPHVIPFADRCANMKETFDVGSFYNIVPLSKIFKNQREVIIPASHPVKANVLDEVDLSKILNQGNAVVMTKNPHLPYLCFICGSLGHAEIIFCAVCCEPFHIYCIAPLDSPLPENKDSWCCHRCQTCAVCGDVENLLKCTSCRTPYHPGCMAKDYPSDYSTHKKAWLCSKCVKCYQCNTPLHDPITVWNFDFCLCSTCSQMIEEDGFCSLCEKFYPEVDSKLLLCSQCSFWVHASCNNVSEATCDLIREYGVEFLCQVCDEDEDSHWLYELKDKLADSFLKIFNCLELCSLEQNPSLGKDASPLLIELSDFSESDHLVVSGQNSDGSVTLKIQVAKEHNESIFTVKPDTLKDMTNKIKEKINESGYIAIDDFCKDILDLINTQVDEKRYNLSQQLSQMLEEEFPWYNQDFLKKHLSSIVAPPYSDHFYAHQKKDKQNDVETSDSMTLPHDKNDDRKCALCSIAGESLKCGRLLYAGQDVWVHSHCAFWSAEVFDEHTQEGSCLQNVAAAISRGRFLRCKTCGSRGATVGCSVFDCPSNFHFPCALYAHVTFQSDKKIFCRRHYSCTDSRLQISIDNWNCDRRQFIDQDGTCVKRAWQSGFDAHLFTVIIGSLTIENLGYLSEASDAFDTLVPVNFKCSRIFWSTANPSRRVRYTIQTFEESIEESPSPITLEKQSCESNHTLVHDQLVKIPTDALSSFLSHMYKGSVTLLDKSGTKKNGHTRSKAFIKGLNLSHVMGNSSSKSYKNYIKSLSLCEYLKHFKLRQAVIDFASSSLSLPQLEKLRHNIMETVSTNKVSTDLLHSLQIHVPIRLLVNGHSYNLPLFNGLHSNVTFYGDNTYYSPPAAFSATPEMGAQFSSLLPAQIVLSPASLGRANSDQNKRPSPLDGAEENGPYKCPNCKRLYRTSKSFAKHVQFCDFVIDSTSSSSSDDEDNVMQAPDNINHKANSNDLKSEEPKVLDNFPTFCHEGTLQSKMDGSMELLPSCSPSSHSESFSPTLNPFQCSSSSPIKSISPLQNNETKVPASITTLNSSQIVASCSPNIQINDDAMSSSTETPSLIVNTPISTFLPPHIMHLPPAVVVPSYIPAVFPPGYTITTPLSYLGSITVADQNQISPISTMQVMPPIPVMPIYNSQPIVYVNHGEIASQVTQMPTCKDASTSPLHPGSAMEVVEAELPEKKLENLGFEKPVADLIETAAKQMLDKPKQLKDVIASPFNSQPHTILSEPHPSPLSKESLMTCPPKTAAISPNIKSQIPSSHVRMMQSHSSSPSKKTTTILSEEVQKESLPVPLSEVPPEPSSRDMPQPFCPPQPPPQPPPNKDKSTNAKKSKLIFEITCEDGFTVRSSSFSAAWKVVLEKLQDARSAYHHKRINMPKQDQNLGVLGLKNDSVNYLVEQLQGAEDCSSFNFSHFVPKKSYEPPLNPSGAARTEPFMSNRHGRSYHDIFPDTPNYLSNNNHESSLANGDNSTTSNGQEEDQQAKSRRSTADLPLSMRFRLLKTSAKDSVAVFRSSIHGRGLFSTRLLEPGEMIIEYAGELIRSILTDKREHSYMSQGIGCYMFRIDDHWVVDATMHGNVARFINHSCDPNCYSKILTIDGRKHIVIFALKRIQKGEELTYDYKFPIEDEKIPCRCHSRKCRKYLN